MSGTRAAPLEWSYNLLGAAERTLLARLAVFAGGCTVESVEAVCNLGGELGQETVDGLQSLLEHSLLRQLPGAGGEPRFALYETVREYAGDKLVEAGELESVRDRHLAFFLALAEQAEPELYRGEQQEWLDRLDREQDNLRAALEWAMECAEDAALRLVGVLWRFWCIRSRFAEGRSWIEAALARSSGWSMPRAQALHCAGMLANYQGDYGCGAALCGESLEMFRQASDKRGIAAASLGLAHAAMTRGDHVAAMALCEEGLAIYRELGDDWGIANALFYLGSDALAQGNFAAARTALEEGAVRFRDLGDTQGTANTLCQLTYTTAFMGEYETARVLSEQALASMRRLGDRRNIARVLLALAAAAFNQGQTDAARSAFEESLGILNELGDRWWGTVCLDGLAGVAAAREQPERAARLLGASERLHEAMAAPVLPLFQPQYEWTLSIARAQLSEGQFATMRAEGRAMTFEQAVAYALES